MRKRKSPKNRKKSDPAPLTFIGLGNPGERYAATRHNIGFQCIDVLAAMLAESCGGEEKWRRRLLPSGEYRYVLYRQRPLQIGAETDASTERLPRPWLLVKPYTYLNNSGNIVPSLFRQYRMTADDIIVIYDTVDMVPGSIKLKYKGRSGGHRGMDSIIAAVGQEFRRVAVGIGRPANGSNIPVSSYVLSPPSDDEGVRLRSAITRICKSFAGAPAESFSERMHYLHQGEAAAGNETG